MLNKTPTFWHSKKQSTVETSTCDLEHSSDRTCVEQILNFCITLRCLGAPIRKLSYMLGDNDFVVKSSMTPQGKICKRHVALSFHRVREAIIAKIISYNFSNIKINPEDVLSNHWLTTLCGLF